MRLIFALALALAICVQPGSAGAQDRPAAPAWRIPSDAAIKTLLVRRVDHEQQGVGMVVGVTGPGGRRIVAHGARSVGGPPVDGETVFEIGSVSKVFTALLLTEMARRSEVRLDQPLVELLPAEASTAAGPGRAITLADLATHTAGLPSFPPQEAGATPDNPYLGFTPQKLFKAFAAQPLQSTPGTTYNYSNFGFAVLGEALARRAGSDYAEVLRQRVLVPLQMGSTRAGTSPAMRARLAQGHDSLRQPAKSWDYPAMSGAGGVWSTAGDLLRLLAVELDIEPSELKPAMDDQLTARRPTPSPTASSALGWDISRTGVGDIVHKGGATGGFRSFVAFNPATREGVVVLANMAGAGVGDIALHLLTGAAVTPLKAPGPVRTAIKLAPERLLGLPGDYQLGPKMVLTITAEDGRLFGSVNGSPRFELAPESERTFFMRDDDTAITFHRQADGPATGFTLHQDGATRDVRRLR